MTGRCDGLCGSESKQPPEYELRRLFICCLLCDQTVASQQSRPESVKGKAKPPFSFEKSGFVSGGFNSDIFASEALHCNGLQIFNKKYSQFF